MTTSSRLLQASTAASRWSWSSSGSSPTTWSRSTCPAACSSSSHGSASGWTSTPSLPGGVSILTSRYTIFWPNQTVKALVGVVSKYFQVEYLCCQGVAGRDHPADHVHPDQRHLRPAPARLLHQGHRRVDGGLSGELWGLPCVPSLMVINCKENCKKLLHLLPFVN